jgi:hypothetical protein
LRKYARRFAMLTMPVVLAFSLGGPASAATSDRLQAIEAERSGNTALSADICDGSDRLLGYIFNSSASVGGIGVVKSVDGHYDQGRYDRVLPVGVRTDSWGWKCADGYYIGGPGYCVDVYYWTGSAWKFGGTGRAIGLHQVEVVNGQEIDRIELKVRRC